MNTPLHSVKPTPVSSLLTFFFLTYAATWACWIPVISGHTSARIPLGTSLWLLGVFAPSLVAITLTALNDGAAGVKALLGRVFQWRIKAHWYLFAVTFMAAVKVSVALLHRVITGLWPHFGNEGLVAILIAILVSTPFQSGEEVGWRGYALPRLAKGMGFGRASLLLGVIWALWHLPQFFLRGADTYGQSFPVWSVEVTAISVAIAWLYAHTNGSLLLVMLMHAAINNSKDIVPSGIASAQNALSLHASLVMYLTAALLWLAAAFFLLRMPDAALMGTENGGTAPFTHTET